MSAKGEVSRSPSEGESEQGLPFQGVQIESPMTKDLAIEKTGEVELRIR